MRKENSNHQSEQNRQFEKECKVIDLRYEYAGYVGEERYAIVSELSEAELWERYPEIIREYVPFVLLSVAQGKVIDEFNQNEQKFQKRQKRNEDVFGYEEGISEIFHPQLITGDCLEILEQYETRNEEHETLKQAWKTLTPIQRQRVIKRCVLQKGLVEIAMEEGVNHSKVDNSVRAAIKKMKKFFEEGVKIGGLCPNK